MTLYCKTGNPAEIRAWYTPQVSGPPECYAFNDLDYFSLEMKLLLSFETLETVMRTTGRNIP